MTTARLHGAPRGKPVTLLLLATSVAGAGVSAWLGRGYLVESWWIWRLRSTDPEVKLEAAQRLGEWKCLRAIPAIVALISQDAEEGVSLHKSGSLASGKPVNEIQVKEVWRVASPLVLSLWQMGDEAIPVISKTVDRFSTDSMVSEKLHSILAHLRNRSSPMTARRRVRLHDLDLPLLPSPLE